MPTSPAKPAPGPERAIGHSLSVLLGFASIIGGVAGLASSLPPVVGVTLLLSGALLVVLAIYSMKHRRAAWAFLISVLSVLPTVTVLGAADDPTVHHLGLGGAAMIDERTVIWPGGERQIFKDVAAGRFYYVKQGGEPVAFVPGEKRID